MERGAANESDRAAVVLLSRCGDGSVGSNAPEACQIVDTTDWCCATVECGVAREVEGEVVSITINTISKAGVTACQCQAGVEYKLVVIGLVARGGDVGAGNSRSTSISGE